jgi:hypothetical protein
VLGHVVSVVLGNLVDGGVVGDVVGDGCFLVLALADDDDAMAPVV